MHVFKGQDAKPYVLFQVLTFLMLVQLLLFGFIGHRVFPSCYGNF